MSKGAAPRPALVLLAAGMEKASPDHSDGYWAIIYRRSWNLWAKGHRIEIPWPSVKPTCWSISKRQSVAGPLRGIHWPGHGTHLVPGLDFGKVLDPGHSGPGPARFVGWRGRSISLGKDLGENGCRLSQAEIVCLGNPLRPRAAEKLEAAPGLS